MQSLRIRNLRNLVDTGHIPINRIVVLLGRNSSGKSTYLRSFPLLRQSIEQDTRSPVLWYGGVSGVDFGNFKTAANRESKEREISFEFQIGLKAARLRQIRNFLPFSRPFGSEHDYESVDNETCVISMSIREDKSNEIAYVSSMLLDVAGNKFNVEVSEGSRQVRIRVNGREVLERVNIYSEIASRGLIPVLRVDTNNKEYRTFRAKRVGQSITSRIHRRVVETIQRFVHGRTGDQSRREIAFQLPLVPLERFRERILEIKGAPESWYEYGKTGRWGKEDIGLLHDYAAASHLEVLLHYCNDYLASFYANTAYVKPIRATGERYYRQQDLAVGDIDSEGANLAFFVDALPSQRQQQLNNWLSESLNIRISTRRDEGHLRLLIAEGDEGRYENISDVGFGYSQVLPFAIQLWHLKNQVRPRSLGFAWGAPSFTLLIEQPELHLHPALQAKIANIIASVISDSNGPKVNVVIETHSREIVNRFGLLVAQRELRRSNVSLALFDSSVDEGTPIRIAKFTEDGGIENWPLGFFEPDI